LPWKKHSAVSILDNRADESFHRRNRGDDSHEVRSVQLRDCFSLMKRKAGVFESSNAVEVHGFQ